jgi:hypothetical protein
MTARTNITARALVAGAALSALGAAAFAGPASAATTAFTDAHGDVAHGADIYRVRVVNGKNVRVKVVQDNLVRSYLSDTSMSVFLDTDRSRKGPEYVFSGGTFEGSDYALLKAKGWKAASRQAEPLRCGYRMDVDYQKDFALVRINRACLGNPGAIRVEVKTGGTQVSTGEGPELPAVDWLGKPRAFSPWVKRG